MNLKIGDILYLRRDKLKGKMSDYADYKFVVTYVREFSEFHENDICISWVDGKNWWFGQIGSTEPWTDLFILERDYSRLKKIQEIGI